VGAYFTGNPVRLRVVTIGLVMFSGIMFYRCVQLDTRLAVALKARAEEARAASEALGG
jgi:hypothetical protein